MIRPAIATPALLLLSAFSATNIAPHSSGLQLSKQPITQRPGFVDHRYFLSQLLLLLHIQQQLRFAPKIGHRSNRPIVDFAPSLIALRCTSTPRTIRLLPTPFGFLLLLHRRWVPLLRCFSYLVRLLLFGSLTSTMASTKSDDHSPLFAIVESPNRTFVRSLRPTKKITRLFTVRAPIGSTARLKSGADSRNLDGPSWAGRDSRPTARWGGNSIFFSL
jgi:hypothetical protein